jgi:hypothetical protein
MRNRATRGGPAALVTGFKEADIRLLAFRLRSSLADALRNRCGPQNFAADR